MFVERAPLRRHIDAGDVAAASAYLLSDDAKNVTGTTLYVDAGYHAMGMSGRRSPRSAAHSHVNCRGQAPARPARAPASRARAAARS